jgi:hypothetical protein
MREALSRIVSVASGGLIWQFARDTVFEEGDGAEVILFDL